jgi:hypothetical protein
VIFVVVFLFFSYLLMMVLLGWVADGLFLIGGASEMILFTLSYGTDRSFHLFFLFVDGCFT